ncbi:MAG: hybrid sensor histidine kinase/response regulator, partial [Caulobacterales bacterium]|nr:hybrid sensor histidine kinase/response regulator [Caulobacterales bacterium]
DAAIAIDAVNRGHVFRFLRKPCEDAVLKSAIDAAVAEHERQDEHERLASRMASCFEHDFRAPLHHIIGFASFLENGGSPAGAIRDYARYIRESGEALVAMTDVLLTLAALRDGRRALDAVDIKARALLCAVSKRHGAAARERRQELAFTADPGDCVLRIDGALMTMALSALASNAIKFAPRGGRIDLLFRRDGDRAVLEVLDTGSGVDPSVTERVMRPFEQADVALARRGDGPGLGLPLAKAAAELHGGELELERAEDGRFAARIILPGRLARRREPAIAPYPAPA